MASRRYKARDLLLINLQVNNSLRASDTLKLEIKDIYENGKFKDSIWFVQQKTGDPGIIGIDDNILIDLNIAIREYDKWFQRGYFNYPSFPLFPSSRKVGLQFRPIAYSTYLNILKQLFSDIGLNPDLYATHSLRSAIPLAFFDSTGDLATTAQMFGHRSVSTTQIYINQVAKSKAAKMRQQFAFRDN
jgi:site-specific recombinase XerD